MTLSHLTLKQGKSADSQIVIRSTQTIERKRAEARAERELARRKRQEAQRARDEARRKQREEEDMDRRGEYLLMLQNNIFYLQPREHKSMHTSYVETGRKPLGGLRGTTDT